MKIHTKKEAIDKMNSLGNKKEPFLFIIDFEMKAIVVLASEEIHASGIEFCIKDACKKGKVNGHKVDINAKAIPFAEYKKGFDLVLNEINHGNSYLLNLTYKSAIELNRSLDEVYNESKAKYKLLWKNKFVVFSPESFIKIQNNSLFSFPMKGTIDAAEPDAASTLLNDEKELAEHYTIVDLIRNDIGKVANTVKVNRFRYLEEIKTSSREILQTSSEIEGLLDPGWESDIGNILFDMLPAGSISGAPKQKTLEIIRAAENGNRGYYTGVFGYFDGKSLDSAVMIRFIEQEGDQYFYRSGGGITYRSKAEDEYEELKQKIYVPIIGDAEDC